MDLGPSVGPLCRDPPHLVSRRRTAMLVEMPSRSPILCASMVAVIAAASVALFFTTDIFTKGLGVCIGFVLLTAIVHRSERRTWGTRGHVSPLSLYTLFWTFYIAILGLATLRGAEADHRLGFSPTAPLRALLVALGSLVLVTIGYRVSSRCRYHRISRSTTQDERLRMGVVLAVLCIGWVCRILLLTVGSIGFLPTGPVSLFVSAFALGDRLLQTGLALLAYGLWSGTEGETVRRWCRLLLLSCLPLLVFVGALSGFKGQLLVDIGPFVIVYFLCRGRVPWRVFGAITLYLVVILPGVERYRLDVQQGAITEDQRAGLLLSAQQILPRIASAALEAPPEDLVRNFVKHVVAEYSATNLTLASILEKTPDEVPFLGVRRLLVFPLVFLPTRQLVDDEYIDIGRYVYVRYLGGTEVASFPPTQPGDLYLSGGWVAIVVGELFVGFLLGWVWRLTGTRTSPRRWILYGLIAVLFSNAGLDLGTLVRVGIQAAILNAVVLRMAFGTSEGSTSLRAVRSARFLGRDGCPVSARRGIPGRRE